MVGERGIAAGLQWIRTCLPLVSHRQKNETAAAHEEAVFGVPEGQVGRDRAGPNPKARPYVGLDTRGRLESRRVAGVG